VGSEEIQKGNFWIRRFPKTEAGRQGETDQEGPVEVPLQEMQEGPPEALLQGQEVRAHGVIQMVHTTNFVKVKCADCGNEQVAFKKPAMPVTCHVCGSTLIKPRGGVGEMKGQLLEVVD
jgi:small subunit ribosomal protein S27e